MDSYLIINSVDFLENQINKKLLEKEKAEQQFNTSLMDKIDCQLSQLLFKLKKEEENINELLSKCIGYSNEEKTMLSYTGQA